MANALIVFTPRSGSTVAGDVLAYKYNALYLDELTTGNIRSPFFEKLPGNVQLKLKQLNLVRNNTRTAPNWSTIYQKYKLSSSFIEHLHKTNSVVLKYFPNSIIPGTRTIQWAIDNNFELYFVTRRNFQQQLYSYLLAEHRQLVYKQTNNNKEAFVNTKSSPVYQHKPSKMGAQQALALITTLCNSLSLWESYRTKFGYYSKTVLYEDNLANNNLCEFGISEDLFNSYNKQNDSIRPTDSYSVGSDIINWYDIVQMARDYHIHE